MATTMALAFLVGLAQAQEIRFPVQGRLVAPAGETTVTVRSAPPHGPFRLIEGAVLAHLAPGTEVEVVAQRSYSSFSGFLYWYQVEPLDGASDQTWWVEGDYVTLE